MEIGQQDSYGQKQTYEHVNGPDVVYDAADVSEAKFDAGKIRPSSKGFRWLMVFCSFFVMMLTTITQMSFGVFITEIVHVFSLSHFMIGLIGAFRLGLTQAGGEINLINY